MDTQTKTLDWPAKGYDGPQPWDHDALGISRSELDKLVTNGGPNNLTPKISHAFPILTSGSADQSVHELGRKLAELGYPNSVSAGENPFGTVDASVLGAVKAFRTAYGVEVDASPFNGNQAVADNHIDPWTVEAILRAQPER